MFSGIHALTATETPLERNEAFYYNLGLEDPPAIASVPHALAVPS